MNNATNALVEVLSGIIGVAIIAVIVGTNSKTSDVISSAGGALSAILAAAMKPVTGGTK